MEASASEALRERKLESEKAQRIVAAMRECVGTRGAEGATFDRVAKVAGVSRGLLHYYFGSKERLLVEVVRQDTELRVAALERNLAPAGSLDAVVEVLVEPGARLPRRGPGVAGRDLRDVQRLKTATRSCGSRWRSSTARRATTSPPP